MEKIPDWFREQIGKLLLHYPSNNRDATVTVNIYWEHLGAYSQSRLTRAVSRCVESCKYFPTVADVLENMPSNDAEYIALPEPKLSGDEHMYRRIYLAYMGWCIRESKKPTEAGIKNFIYSTHYKIKRKVYPQGESALAIINKYSRPEYWNV